jgi:hypothetical protein
VSIKNVIREKGEQNPAEGGKSQHVYPLKQQKEE